MKKKKWAMLVLVLCIVFMFPAAVFAREKDQSSAETDTSVTKIEWIHTLSEQFSKSENFEDIIIADMKEADEYYQDAVWAIGKGFVSLDKNGNFNPTETVSKGFSAYTLSLCLDIQTENSTTEADISAIPKDAKYYAYDVVAVSRGWFILDENTFDDSKPVSKEEIKRMMEDAKAILSMQNITAVDESHDFADTVIEVPKEEDVSIEDNGENTEVTIQDSDTEIKEGDTFIVYQDSLPIAYEAQKVEQPGNDAVISASRADDDAYGNLNEQGQLQLNASNAEFNPSDKVEVLEDTFAVNSAKDGGRSVEYKDGKIVLSLSQGGSTISVSLSNLAIKYSVTESGTMMALTGKWSVLSELVTKDDIIDLADTPLGEIRVLGVGVIKLQFRFGMSLSTKATCSGTFTAGVSTLSDGTARGIHEFNVDYNNSSIAIKGKIEFSLRVSAGLDVLVMHGLVYGDIGLTTEASQEHHNVDDDGDGVKEIITCDDIQEYFTLKVGYDVKLFKVTLLSDSISAISDDNKNHPVIFRIHFENGLLVSKCRFGMTVEEPDFGSKFSGGASSADIDWSNRHLDVGVTLHDDVEVEGSLTISGNGGIDLNGYTLKVDGDLLQETGLMKINGGKLRIEGDYRIQKYDEKKETYVECGGKLRVEGENSEVIVGGDFYTQSTAECNDRYDSYNCFDGGKITLKGNFTQLKGNVSNFQGDGTRIVFAGCRTQEISFETPESSYLRYPRFENKDIAVKSAIGNWDLNDDITIKDEGSPLEIVGFMNLNGNALTVERDTRIKSGDINIQGGTFKVTGNLVQESGRMTPNGGKLEVGGDYRIQKYDTKKETYGESGGLLRVNGEKSEVTVGGNFYMQSTVECNNNYNSCNSFDGGKITLKGNFTQLEGNAANFQAGGTKVVFAGTGLQEVYIETPSSSYISNPVYQNTKVCYVGTRRIALSKDGTTLTAALPGNDKAISEGIIYSEDSNPTLDTPGRIRIAFTENTDNEVNFNAKGLKGNTFRAYIIIKDVAGNDRIFYSEPVKIAG